MNKELQYLIEQNVDIKYNVDDGHIFLVTSWTNTIEKEKLLVKCLKKLKEFNIPILLAVNYPVRDEIQKLVDYYVFEDKNEILPFDEFHKVSFDSNIYTTMYLNNYKYDIVMSEKYNHHYAVLKNITKAFGFCKNLNKKYIHYVEYDCILDTQQYYNTFLQEIKSYDFVIKPILFSINIDIAMKMVNEIPDSIYEFYNRQYWNYHNYFSDGLPPYEYNVVAKYTDKIKISNYIDNNKTLNLIRIHNDGLVLKNINLPNVALVAGDDTEDLYIRLYSNFELNDNYIIEIKYQSFNIFYNIKLNFDLINIGKYIKDSDVELRIMGNTFFKEKLTEDFQQFKKRCFFKKNYLG